MYLFVLLFYCVAKITVPGINTIFLLLNNLESDEIDLEDFKTSMTVVEGTVQFLSFPCEEANKY